MSHRDCGWEEMGDGGESMMAKNELAMSTAGVEWKAGAHGGRRCEKQQAGTVVVVVERLEGVGRRGGAGLKQTLQRTCVWRSNNGRAQQISLAAQAAPGAAASIRPMMPWECCAELGLSAARCPPSSARRACPVSRQARDRCSQAHMHGKQR